MSDIGECMYRANPDYMNQTSSIIEESGENIEEEYNELVEVDEEFLAELNGDISTDFSNAANRIEVSLKIIYRKLNETSEILTDYTYKMRRIDISAEQLLGGHHNGKLSL